MGGHTASGAVYIRTEFVFVGCRERPGEEMCRSVFIEEARVGRCYLNEPIIFFNLLRSGPSCSKA